MDQDSVTISHLKYFQKHIWMYFFSWNVRRFVMQAPCWKQMQGAQGNMDAHMLDMAIKIKTTEAHYNTHRESVTPFSAQDAITIYLYTANSCLLTSRGLNAIYCPFKYLQLLSGEYQHVLCFVGNEQCHRNNVEAMAVNHANKSTSLTLSLKVNWSFKV